MSLITAATVRGDIASYVDALFGVYILLLFIYILVNLMLSLGLRPPYARWFDAVMGFLRDISEPYLRLFRRLIPAVGMFDLSPIIAIFVLVILRTIIVRAIGG